MQMNEETYSNCQILVNMACYYSPAVTDKEQPAELFHSCFYNAL